MSKNITAVSIFLLVLSVVTVPGFAEEERELKLEGTVHVYPKEFQQHDLLYVRVELQNKNDKPVMDWKSFERDFDVGIALFGESEDDYYSFPYNGCIDWFKGFKVEIEPGESFIAFRDSLEFPEYITLNGERTGQAGEEGSRKFVENYIGTGKKCKLMINLMETGKFFSDPIEVTSRDAKEMAAIETWYAEFKCFLGDTSRHYELRAANEKFTWTFKWRKVPTVKDYENFENQLSAGTLKNYIKYRRLLASIPDNEDVGPPPFVPNRYFRELGDHLDTLHPFERDVLIRDAFSYFANTSGNNNQRMLYLLLSKMPKEERKKWLGSIHKFEDRKAIFDLPEPEYKYEP